MVRKTDGERIDEIGQKLTDLSLQVARFDERTNNIREIAKTLNDLGLLVKTLTEQSDNVRDEMKDLNRDQEEASRRLWLIVPPLLAALTSAGLTTLVNYLLRH